MDGRRSAGDYGGADGGSGPAGQRDGGRNGADRGWVHLLEGIADADGSGGTSTSRATGGNVAAVVHGRKVFRHGSGDAPGGTGLSVDDFMERHNAFRSRPALAGLRRTLRSVASSGRCDGPVAMSWILSES